MPSSPWVKLDLIVFDTPLRAKALLKSFEKCVKSNITEPGLETVGKACTFTLKTGEALPAFRNSVWMDMDCEDALDE